MITVSSCEIRPQSLCGDYAKVPVQEGQLKRAESVLLDRALGGCLLPYLAKRQYSIKIYRPETGCKILTT